MGVGVAVGVGGPNGIWAVSVGFAGAGKALEGGLEIGFGIGNRRKKVIGVHGSTVRCATLADGTVAVSAVYGTLGARQHSRTKNT